MSERGSFVTEYIYCSKCFEVVKKVLLVEPREKYLCSVQVPIWKGDKDGLPIIAGKIGGLHKDEELEVFEDVLIPEIKRGICHVIKIAVLPDSGNATIYTVEP